MQLVVFATAEEANATLLKTQARQQGSHFVFDHGIIVISGIGPFAGYTAIEPFIAQASIVINPGIAGALHDGIQVGSIYSISSVAKLIWHPKQSTTTEALCIGTAGQPALCTVDFPLHCPTLRDQLQSRFDLVDMEGYAICLQAHRHKKPVQLYKIASDRCTEETSQEIKKNLPFYSQMLCDILYAKNSSSEE